MGAKKKKTSETISEPVSEEIVERSDETTTLAELEKIDASWFGGCAAITAVAVFLRFYWLDLKPFHHDEGVNGFFLTTLFKDGTYHYDPANYHGPTLYYISLAFSKVFGLTTISVRSSVAVFGVLTVILTFFLKRYLGKIGTLSAALFLALSPGMVYISRYFIHEMFFVFCSLAVVVSVVYFIEKRKAGIFAIGWMALILLVCFLPSALNLAGAIAGEKLTLVWVLRIAFFLVESALVYLVIRMMLSWDSGRPVYLLLSMASVAFMFATKETAFITLGTMLIACFAAWLWRSIALTSPFRKNLPSVVVVGHILLLAVAAYQWRAISDGFSWVVDYFVGDGRIQEPFALYTLIALLVITVAAWGVFLMGAFASNDTELEEPAELTWPNFRGGLGGGSDMILLIAALATVFVYINVVFFSSFFTYKEGVGKAIEAYAIWTKTGNKDHTQNGVAAYLKWGMKVESPLLLLSSLGALIALIRAKHRFAVFAAFWAFGLFAAYTLIPYKTPWLALSFYLPMCLIAGYGINELATGKNLLSKVSAGLAAGAAAVLLGYQAYDLNFVRYDDEEMGYVYAHTKRPFMELMQKIDYYANKSSLGNAAAVEVVSPDYWPMPWYTANLPNVTYHGVLADVNTSEMIVAKKAEQDVEVIKRYTSHYKLAGIYPLRPGVDLVLLVRKDLADPDAKELYRIGEWESR